MLVMVMILSMMLGVNMVSDVYADDIWGTTYICTKCLKTYNRDLTINNAHHFHGGDCPYHPANAEKSGLNPLSTVISLSEYEAMQTSKTSISLVNSTANVDKLGTITKDSGSTTFDDETTNVWNNGNLTEETRVTVDRASYFTITIPKEIVLNGNDGTATYEVSATGELAGDQILKVVPIADEIVSRTFKLNEDGGKQINVTVTQNDTEFDYQNLIDNKVCSGSLLAPDISAGNWSGKFDFNITFTNN